MKRTLVRMLLSAATLWGCGDTPEPVPEESEPAVQGVYGRAPAADQGVPSVVTLTPVAGGSSEAPEEPVVMDQLGLAFLPTTLIAHPGQTVRFTNSETLAHNVHVTRMENDSTVFFADMNPDDRLETRLSAPGGYDVTCDVHPGMRAVVYVTAAPYATFAEAEGSFVLPGVPPGSYEAAVWRPTTGVGDPRSVDVTGPRTELDLTAVP
jgi:plastocyanin